MAGKIFLIVLIVLLIVLVVLYFLGKKAQKIDQTPKLMRRSKLPIVKAKIGPKIMSLVADESIYDLIPVKKEVKAEVSGIYILNVRGLRGALTPPPKKKGWFKRMKEKALK